MSLTNLKSTEPLRLYLYGLLAPVLALLVFFGVITDEAVPLFTALGGAILIPAVGEVVRSKVDSPATAAAKEDTLARYVLDSDSFGAHADGEEG